MEFMVTCPRAGSDGLVLGSEEGDFLLGKSLIPAEHVVDVFILCSF